MSNPVHYNEANTTNFHGQVETPGWYFWDETWADRMGPFKTKAEAEHMVKRYADEVLDGKTPDHDLNECQWCGCRDGLHANDCK